MPPPDLENTAETPPEADDTPPETLPPAAKSAKTSTKPFPMPPRAGKGGFCKPEEGLEYWRKIGADPRFKDRVAVYINRENPVLNHLQELSPEDRALVESKKKRAPSKYIDKPPDPFGEDHRMEFLHRYGSGIYKCYVNDIGVEGHKRDPKNPDLSNRNVVRFLYSIFDSDYPPILDPNRPDKGLGLLDLNHPANQSYIGDLRQRGILPPISTGEDMASSSVVEKLVDKLDNLTEKVNEGKQAATLAEIKDQLNAKSGDLTTQLLLAVINRPQQNDMAPMLAMFQTQMQQMQQANQTQITLLSDALRDEREDRRKLEAQVRETGSKEPPDPFAWFERMTTTMSKAKELFGGGPATGAAGAVINKASKMSGTLEFFAEVLPKIAEAPILNAIAQRIMQGGGAATAADITSVATGAANPAGNNADILRFVQMITPPMLNYLEDPEADGEDFATWIHAGYPARLIELQKHGPDVIIATYRNSPTWARIAPREARFVQFVRDFCAFRPEPKGDAIDIDPTGSRPNGAPPPEIDFDAPIDGHPIV